MVEFTTKQIHWAISPVDVLMLRFRDSLKQFCLTVASFRSVTPQLPKTTEMAKAMAMTISMAIPTKVWRYGASNHPCRRVLNAHC